jgi:hypothetical protein
VVRRWTKRREHMAAVDQPLATLKPNSLDAQLAVTRRLGNSEL